MRLVEETEKECIPDTEEIIHLGIMSLLNQMYGYIVRLKYILFLLHI